MLKHIYTFPAKVGRVAPWQVHRYTQVLPISVASQWSVWLRTPLSKRQVNKALEWSGKTCLNGTHMAVGQNLVPLVNIKIAGKWMFIPLKMVLIGIDPYPYDFSGSIVTRLPHIWPTPGMYKNAAPWLPPLPEHWKSGRPKPQKKAQRVGPGDPKSI